MAELLEVGVGVLAQAGGVQGGHPEVGHAQPQPVLARGALLEIAERDERDHVAVRGRAAHPELVRDVGDPEHGTLGREAAQDRKPALQRLAVARLA